MITARIIMTTTTTTTTTTSLRDERYGFYLIAKNRPGFHSPLNYGMKENENIDDATCSSPALSHDRL
jgi:hypothetical protein